MYTQHQLHLEFQVTSWVMRNREHDQAFPRKVQAGLSRGQPPSGRMRPAALRAVKCAHTNHRRTNPGKDLKYEARTQALLLPDWAKVSASIFSTLRPPSACTARTSRISRQSNSIKALATAKVAVVLCLKSHRLFSDP